MGPLLGPMSGVVRSGGSSGVVMSNRCRGRCGDRDRSNVDGVCGTGVSGNSRRVGVLFCGTCGGGLGVVGGDGNMSWSSIEMDCGCGALSGGDGGGGFCWTGTGDEPGVVLRDIGSGGGGVDGAASGGGIGRIEVGAGGESGFQNGDHGEGDQGIATIGIAETVVSSRSIG